MMWEFWASFGLTFLIVYFFLNHRFKIIEEGKKVKYRVLLFIIAMATQAITTFISQLYFHSAMGNLKEVKNVNEISSFPAEQFYKIHDYDIDGMGIGMYTDFRVSGKYNENLNVELFVTYPITINDNDSATVNNVYWYGLSFKEQFNNRLSDEEIDTLYSRFMDRSLEKLGNNNIKQAKYFERLMLKDDSEYYLKAINSFTKSTTENVVVLIPHTNSFESRNGNKLFWIFISYAIGLSLMVLVLIPLKLAKSYTVEADDDFSQMLRFLVPRGDHFIISILILLNSAVFLAMFFSGMDIMSLNGMEVLKWGGQRREEVLMGEWWRLITAVFVHGGLSHFIYNMIGLAFTGLFLERHLGRRNFLILYFVSGICSGIASIWWSEVVSAGASGAIYGLFGCAFALLSTNFVPKESRSGILLTYSLLFIGGILSSLFMSNIGHAAHIGGFLSGVVVGYLIYFLDRKLKFNSNRSGFF